MGDINVLILGLLFVVVVVRGDLDNVVNDEILGQEIRLIEIAEDSQKSNGNDNSDLQHDTAGHSSVLDNVINDLENVMDKREIDEVLSDVSIPTSVPTVIISNSYAKVEVANNISQEQEEDSHKIRNISMLPKNITETVTEYSLLQGAFEKEERERTSDTVLKMSLLRSEIDTDTADIVDTQKTGSIDDTNDMTEVDHDKINKDNVKERENSTPLILKPTTNPHLYTKCCPPGSVLYLPHAGPPVCERLQHHSPPDIRPPTNTTAQENWEVDKVDSPRCKSSEILLTVAYQDFTLLVSTSSPTSLLYLSRVDLVAGVFCIDHGIQDGEELQLFAQGCLVRERLCSANTCHNTCDGVASVAQTKGEYSSLTLGKPYLPK